MGVSRAIFLLAAVFPVFAATPPTLLLAATRAGWVEAIDPATLETVARIETHRSAESVASSPDGERLFVAMPRASKDACCAMFAFDAAGGEPKEFEWPAMRITPAGDRLLAQRGNTGIDVFDAHTLQALPAIRAPGVYRLQASPNGHAAFGVTYFPEPAVDLFNLLTGERVVSHVFARGSSVAGTFVGNDYYLFAVEEGEARIHHVRSDTGQFEERVVSFPASEFPPCEETPYDVAAAGANIAIYAQFGLKSDGRCAAPGGYVLADPGARSASPRLAPGMHFRQLVGASPTPSEAFLYGLDAGSDRSWSQTRIVKLDPATGKVVAEKKLAPGVWYLAAGPLDDAFRERRSH